MSEFEIPYEFQSHYVDFWIELFPSTYEFEIWVTKEEELENT